MSLLPRSPDIVSDAGPRVVGVDSDAADDLMSALSSETARRILVELHEEPAPPAELADRAGTTLQNTQYHLENLEEAGAIDVVGTAYSEKGREMDVYAPADEPLVIFAGREESASGLRAALSRLLGGLAALALASLVVQELFGRRSLAELLPFDRLGGTGGAEAPGGGQYGGPPAEGGAAPNATATPTSTPASTPSTGSPDVGRAMNDTAGAGGDGAPTDTVSATPGPEQTATETATATPTDTATEIATETAANATATPELVRSAAETAGGLPPGLLFFLGGALVLTVGIAVTYGRR